MTRIKAFALLSAACAAGSVYAATYPVTGPAAPTQWQGRYIDNKNGTASFDWPGVRVSFTVSATTAISMSLSAPGNLVGEIRVYIDGVNGSTIIVDKSATNYPVASGLDASKQYSVTLYNVLEPALWHPQPFLPKAGDTIATLNSITVDGTLLTPPAPLKRNLVFVGDSITAGFGAGAEAPCGTSPTYQEANDNTYGNMLCGYFAANCSIVAWSGKGLYVNSPTAGTAETLPFYYQSATGVFPYTTDWDQGRFTPDAVVINLGTNDYGHNHDTGPAWEKNFTEAYVTFMTSLTKYHANPSLPIFAAMGPLTQAPVKQIQAAITEFNAMGGNATFLDLHTSPGSDGCSSHPGLRGHTAMFKAAQPQISKFMGWA